MVSHTPSTQLIHTRWHLTMTECSNNLWRGSRDDLTPGKVSWSLYINSTLGVYAVTSVGWGLISHWEVDMSVNNCGLQTTEYRHTPCRDLCELTVPNSRPVNHRSIHHHSCPTTGLTPHQITKQTAQRGSSYLATQTHDEGFLHKHKTFTRPYTRRLVLDTDKVS